MAMFNSYVRLPEGKSSILVRFSIRNHPAIKGYPHDYGTPRHILFWSNPLPGAAGKAAPSLSWAPSDHMRPHATTTLELGGLNQLTYRYYCGFKLTTQTHYQWPFQGKSSQNMALYGTVMYSTSILGSWNSHWHDLTISNLWLPIVLATLFN